MRILLGMLSVLFLFSATSCVMPDSSFDGNGHIVVSNVSPDNVAITAIYVKSESAAGYDKVFTGEIVQNRNHCLEVTPAAYSVKITVFYPPTIIAAQTIGVSKEFETGYKTYKYVDAGKYIYIDFDGNGIYFR